MPAENKQTFHLNHDNQKSPQYLHTCSFLRCKYEQSVRFSSHGSTAPECLGLLNEVPRSHSDTQHSVWLLWASDRPVAEISTWKYTTVTTDGHPCPDGISARNPSKRAAEDPFPTCQYLPILNDFTYLTVRVTEVMCVSDSIFIMI